MKMENKNLEEIQNREIFNFKIPSFLNDLKKNKLNQINNEGGNFEEIEQSYSSTLNYNNDSKDNWLSDSIFKSYNIFEEIDDKGITNRSTGETFNNYFDKKSNNSKIYDNEELSDSSFFYFNKSSFQLFDDYESDEILNSFKLRFDTFITKKKRKRYSPKIQNNFESNNNKDPPNKLCNYKMNYFHSINKSSNYESKRSTSLNSIEIDDNLKIFGLCPSKLLNNLQDKNYNNNSFINNNVFLNAFNSKNYVKICHNRPFEEPPLINLKNILDDKNNKSMIEKLGKQINICFDNDNLLKIENGIIFKNLLNYLTKSKKKNGGVEMIRKFMPDEMSIKIKTFLLKQIIDNINSFEEMKNNKIIVLNAELINKEIKGDFNYLYFSQYIYSIISNESKYKNNNYKIIEDILKKEKDSGLVKHLKFTIKDYLDIIRYKKTDKTDDSYKEKKLEDFLIFEYNNFEKNIKRNNEVKNINYFKNLLYEKEEFKKDKKIILEDIKKDYICSLLLLTFNLERFFYLRGIKKRNREKKVDRKNNNKLK